MINLFWNNFHKLISLELAFKTMNLKKFWQKYHKMLKQKFRNTHHVYSFQEIIFERIIKVNGTGHYSNKIIQFREKQLYYELLKSENKAQE